jgi:uncharacterized protein YkwD
MLKYFLHFLFTCFFFFNLFNQSLPKLQPTELDQRLINKLFTQHLNHLRDSLHLTKLKGNSILDSAAKDQSAFMAKKKILTHDQPTAIKKEPFNRVEYYNGSFNLVGENVLMLPLNIPFTIKSKQFVILNYEELAYCMFLTWKNSPGHYKNMITPGYKNSGLYVSYDAKSNSIYSANVFGGDQYIALKEFETRYIPRDIKYDVDDKFIELKNKSFSVSAANYVYLEEDSAFLYHDFLPEIKPFFKNVKDGLMVDYVIREQFTCKSENRLDFSPIYDGYLQKPIYTAEIFSKNTNKMNNELNSGLAHVPNEIKTKLFQPNIVLLKDNIAYKYSIPLTVVNADYMVLEFQPMFNYDYKQIDTFIKFSFRDKIFFDKGTSNPIQDDNYYQSILNLKYLPQDAKFKNVKIIGFSSIEGDSVQNQSLQLKRVKYLEQFLIKYNHVSSSLIKTSIKANKEDFEKDFGKKLNVTSSQSLVELNQVYNKNKDFISDSILSTHRYSSLEYELEFRLNNSTSISALEFIYEKIDEMDVKTKTALLKILFEKYKTETVDELDFVDPKDFESIKNEKLLLPLFFYVSDSTMFRKMYLKIKANQNWNEKDKYNFIISNFRYYQYYRKPFIQLCEIDKMIDGISGKLITTELRNLLKLNHYLIEVHYYNKLKKFEDRNTTVIKFKNLFLSFNPSINDIIGVGLFLNYYNMFDLTLELLKPKLTLYPDNEELWFSYLSTYTFNNYDKYEETEVLRLINQCKKINKKRLCAWINIENFQLLRDPIYKKMFCSICE